MILDNNPNAKIVLWAHGGHISKENGRMGSYISKKYGDKYYNIDFLSNTGTYTAVSGGRIYQDNILAESKPGSFEFSFHNMKIPIAFFDFSQVNEKEPESKWLTKRLYYRSIGAEARDNLQFFEDYMSKYFNAFIYIDSTQGSHCFEAQ